MRWRVNSKEYAVPFSKKGLFRGYLKYGIFSYMAYHYTKKALFGSHGHGHDDHGHGHGHGHGHSKDDHSHDHSKDHAHSHSTDSHSKDEAHSHKGHH